jgi:hypothetical protein
MKTKIEINGFEITIEEKDGMISVTAEQDGDIVEEFTLDATEMSKDNEESFGEEEEDFEDEEAQEEAQEMQDEEEEAQEEAQDEEESDMKLESFGSFIKRKTSKSPVSKKPITKRK